jgi:hypothetical protein
MQLLACFHAVPPGGRDYPPGLHSRIGEKLISVQAMSWVIDESEHSLGSLIVLLMIANHAKSDGTDAWPSIRTIARESRLSESQTHRCIRKLQRSGELGIDVGQGPRGTNLYHLPKMMQRKLEGGRKLEGVPKKPKGGVTAMAPEPSLNRPNLRTPLPPVERGEKVLFVEWHDKILEVQMGRKRRLPSLNWAVGLHGCYVQQVIDFLKGKGFSARVLEESA